MSNTITGNISIEATLSGNITIGGGGSDTLGEAMSETGLAEYENDSTVIHPVVVKKVTAPNATTLANAAFANSWVEEVDAENVVTVGEGAFYSASYLKKLKLGKVTSVGKYAFRSMGTSENNDIELHLDVSTIDYSDYTLYQSKLKSLTVDSLATINGSVFESMNASGAVSFPDATELKANGLKNVKCNTLSLPNVTTIGQYALSSTEISSNYLKLDKVTTIPGNGCPYLKCNSLELPSVTSMGSRAFQLATVTDLYLPGDTMCALESGVDNVFYSCPIYTSADARVHVKASLESTYKADSNWSAIADKIVGDL